MSAASLKAAMDRQGQQQTSQAASSAADSNWVPDEQVSECPLCNRKFGSILLGKHHCRACGRVVCGSCSDNQIFVPQKGSKARVCDTCHDLSRVDKHSALTDSLNTSRQVETTLKNHLKEMTQQADWFRSFLLQISSEANAPPGGVHSPGPSTDIDSNMSSFCPTESFLAATDTFAGAVGSTDEGGAGVDVASSFVTTNSELVTEEELMEDPSSSSAAAQDGLSLALASLRNREIHDLIHRSRRRWKETCQEVATKREENGRLEMDIEVLDKDYTECQQEIKQLYKVVQNMENDLKQGSLRQAERDQLKQRTEVMQEELNGLQQRMATLEDAMPRSSSTSRSGSFLNFGSSTASPGAEGASFVARRCCCNDNSDSEGQDNRRCIRSGGCSIM